MNGSDQEEGGRERPDEGQPGERSYGGFEPADGPAAAPPPADFGPPSSEAELRRRGAAQAWGMACHLSTLVTFCFRLAWWNVPGVIAPLILWQLFDTRQPAAVHHAREAFHFQMNVLGWLLIAWVLSSFCCLGPWLTGAVTVANVVLTLAAAANAAEGERWRYPGIVRLFDDER